MANENAYLKRKLVIWCVITLVVFATRFYLAFAWLDLVFVLCVIWTGLLFLSYCFFALKNLNK
ncbi:hypothetical protein D3Z56_28115 [Lachnospiraceae bacterium]|nr:hypothetical protein [Lachnospiraceae bacterium]